MSGQPCHRVNRKGKPRGEIVAVSSNEPNARTIATRQNTELIVLDFV
jgi:hypothetical protein